MYHLLVLFCMFHILFAQSLKDIKDNVLNGKKPMHGVNLGGWLVAEYWMTKESPIWHDVPDNIANKGEYKTMEYLGHDLGDSRFREHRDTFITEQDFADIKRANLNLVRIPIGYWITGFDHWGGDTYKWKIYASGALDYLDRAVKEWAPKHNLLVFLSMHAAKGSQNGNHYSAPENLGNIYWSQYEENVNNTLDTVAFLAHRYKDDLAFIGISLLNEPSAKDTSRVDEGVLKQYYKDAYARIRPLSNCFLGISPLLSQQEPTASDWASFMGPPQYYGLLHEWHRYQIWYFEGRDAENLISYVQKDLKNAINSWKGNWLFIGEWSLASNATFSNEQLKRYAKAQLDAFSGAHAGWAYWTWKFYNDDGNSTNGWSMKSMINHGFLQLH